MIAAGIVFGSMICVAAGSTSSASEENVEYNILYTYTLMIRFYCRRLCWVTKGVQNFEAVGDYCPIGAADDFRTTWNNNLTV